MGARQAKPGRILAVRTFSDLETPLRERLKLLQYRHGILSGLLTATGLTLDQDTAGNFREPYRYRLRISHVTLLSDYGVRLLKTTPLAVLDLVPVPSGADASMALHNSIDLARQAEAFGYSRYWIAEHHLNPGLASTSPAVLLAMAAAATSTMRIGSGAVLLGHKTALAVVEEFGLLEAMHPGRIDLGLGNTSGRGKKPSSPPDASPEPDAGERRVDGLLIPSMTNVRKFAALMATAPLHTLQRTLLYAPGSGVPDYDDQVGDILDMMAGRYSHDGLTPRIVPGDNANPEVWIMGSSAGTSAAVAGRRGLRFAASYHVLPATTLEAVAAYRAAFKPSDRLDKPYVSVSADVVVASDERTAKELATGYGPWVHSIRTGQGAIPFPTPQEARAYKWTREERALVADRVETQFVGDPVRVANDLEVLRDVTGADELVITTITHNHADRIRSYQLLAEEWQRRKS